MFYIPGPDELTDDQALNICANIPNYDAIAKLAKEKGVMDTVKAIREDCRIGLVEAKQVWYAVKKVEGL